MDTFVASARHLLDQTVADTRRSIDGLTTEQLNRRPGADDTNSIAVLVVHGMTSTRWWLSVALQQPVPDRERDREFETAAPDAAWLGAFLEDMAAQCRVLLVAAADVDWTAVLRPDGQESSFPASFALTHCLSHLREHEGQISLTRQLLAAS